MGHLEPFREQARKILESVLATKDIDIQPDLVDAPQGMGDLSLPCFPLSRTLKMSPVDIAKELAVLCEQEMKKLSVPLIERIEAVNGYLNFHFSEQKLVQTTLSEIRTLGKEYEKGKDTGTTIILEHTSANPNGPFHIGRARNPIIGDTLARILTHAGYDVTTEYYVNDMGKQAVTLAWGIEHLMGKTPEGQDGNGSEFADNDDDYHGLMKDEEITEGMTGVHVPLIDYTRKDDHRLVPYYQRASSMMNEDDLVLDAINSMLEKYERGDRELGKVIQGYCNMVLEGMKDTLHRMNIQLDSYAYESSFVYNGAVAEVIETLRRSPHSREEEGAHYLELESFGVHGRDTRFFYTRTGGTSLYTTRDLAYHMDKFRRGERVVNVLGEDHKLQAQQLSIALGELGEERRPEISFYSFVSLPEGKMSTRRGRVVYLDHLMDEAVERAYQEVTTRRPELPEDEKQEIARVVGVGSVRYNIIRVQMEKSMVFRWEDAMNFEGDSAPFIQYTHARACSILRKSESHPEPDGINIHHHYEDPNEIALIRHLARFPDKVQECARVLKTHSFASFIRDLAQLFNQFYRECPVLAADPEIRIHRLLLVTCFKDVLATGLRLLGIDAPESM